MQIKDLDPKKYKRFFAFGCSFTNYKWPTWADIIGHDIPVYENWGEPGAGNHFIFNSFIEANTRYTFTKDDLVIIMWSFSEREDRYLKNKWQHDTVDSIEKTYGTKWVKQFYQDGRSFLIRDLAYIQAVQTILKNAECDWCNLLYADFFRSSKISSELKNNKINRDSAIGTWKKELENILKGNQVSDIFDNSDVIHLYQDIFKNISYVYEDYKHEDTIDRIDKHPIPIEALGFLDHCWPNNTLSDGARQYANTVRSHDLKVITRL
jgi:hypothetical protein